MATTLAPPRPETAALHADVPLGQAIPWACRAAIAPKIWFGDRAIQLSSFDPL